MKNALAPKQRLQQPEFRTPFLTARLLPDLSAFSRDGFRFELDSCIDEVQGLVHRIDHP
jgi:hypothetical protein